MLEELVVEHIKKESVDPFDYKRLTVLALESLGFPLSRTNLQEQMENYDPLTEELALAPTLEIARGIQDLIDALPGTYKLSVAQFVYHGMPDFILPFLNSGADQLVRLFHPKIIDDLGENLIEAETLNSCYLRACLRMRSKSNHQISEYPTSKLDPFYDNLISQGVKPITAQSLAIWISSSYKLRLVEKADLARIIFGEPAAESNPPPLLRVD